VYENLLLLRAGGEQLLMGIGATRMERIATPEQWAIKAEALRELFRQTLGEQPDVDCPLDLRVEDELDRGEHVERRVTYNVEPDERVASIVLVPKGLTGPAPAMLCIHPTNTVGKEQSIGRDGTEQGMKRAYGLHLAQRGYVTLSPDLLGAGERIYPGCRSFDNTPFYAKHPRWSGSGKDVWDMRRAVDALCAMPEVDAERLGSIGHSQGSSVTVYTAALEPRIKVAVSNCGLWPWAINKNPFHLARNGWWIGRPALRPYIWSGKAPPADTHELFACIAPRPLLNVSALNDFQYSADESEANRPAWQEVERAVSEVYALLGAAGKFRQVLHAKGHDFDDPERDLAYRFVDEMLRPA
jgi:dienelactone hydrolase